MGHATSAQQGASSRLQKMRRRSHKSASPGTAGDGAQTLRPQVANINIVKTLEKGS